VPFGLEVAGFQLSLEWRTRVFRDWNLQIRSIAPFHCMPSANSLCISWGFITQCAAP